MGQKDGVLEALGQWNRDLPKENFPNHTWATKQPHHRFQFLIAKLACFPRHAKFQCFPQFVDTHENAAFVFDGMISSFSVLNNSGEDRHERIPPNQYYQ